MSKIYDDAVLSLSQAIEIEKGNIPLKERKGMPAKTYYAGDCPDNQEEGRAGTYVFHKIKELRTDDNLNLYAIFSNGIEKVYNVRDMFPVYAPMKELEDLTLFRQARLSPGGYAVVWNDDLDLDGEEIWECGIEIKKPI